MNSFKPARHVLSALGFNWRRALALRRASAMGRSWSICRWALPLSLVLLAAFASAQDIDASKAAAVKAAYLRHIAALTTWPADKAGASDRPISIGLLGPDPNGVISLIRARSQSAQGLQAQGRDLQVLDVVLPGDGTADEEIVAVLQSHDLLFLSDGSQPEWRRIQPLIRSLPIVTVGEIENFADEGGMIEYFIDFQAGQIRMIVNLDVMRNAGVVLSSRLLALNSVTVTQGGTPGP